MKTWTLTLSKPSKFVDKIFVIRQIRLLTGLGLRESKDISDSLPRRSHVIEITYDPELAPMLEKESLAVFAENGISVNDNPFPIFIAPGHELFKL